MSAEAKTFNLLHRMPALAKLKLVYVVSNTVPSFKMIEWELRPIGLFVPQLSIIDGIIYFIFSNAQKTWGFN